MTTYDLAAVSDDEFVVHFGGRPSEVDVYTFTNALLGIADALREINSVVNPGLALEIKIEALGPGSFRAKIKTAKQRLPTFLRWGAEHIVLPLFLAFLFERYLTRDSVRVEVSDDYVVIHRGNDRIVLPKEAYAHKDKIDQNAKVASGCVGQ